MKKIIIFVLGLVLVLSGCCYVTEKKSISEYKEKIAINGFGFSDIELDKPPYYLPSDTFLDDYEYLEGDYYFYEPSIFNEFCTEYWKPNIVLLTLNYDKDVYLDAKDFTINNIPKYEDYFYTYNDYQFYVNKNFMDRYVNISVPEMPNIFTMVCYNDEYNIICFLGFANTYPELDEKYLNNLDENWESFIDQYYGEYYDFSE